MAAFEPSDGPRPVEPSIEDAVSTKKTMMTPLPFRVPESTCKYIHRRVEVPILVSTKIATTPDTRQGGYPCCASCLKSAT